MVRFACKGGGWKRALLFGVSAPLLVLTLFPLVVWTFVVPLARRGYSRPIARWIMEHAPIYPFVTPPVFLFVPAFAFLLFIASVILSALRDARRATIGFAVLLFCLLTWVFMLPVFTKAREKPVIYLYPQKEVVVNVRLRYDGRLVHTRPKYAEDGWTVIAGPSGRLSDLRTGTSYSYLVWEGVDTYTYAVREGFLVEGKDARRFLASTLPQLGLSEREASDFIAYWLPRLEKNRYNVVHFATDEYARQVPLEISPRPDTLIRVFMVFRRVDAAVDIPPQKLSAKARRGFTVVEWGGTELR